MSRNDPVTIIIRALMSEDLCASCIVARTSLSLDEVTAALGRMARIRATTQTDERCPSCGNAGPVYRIADVGRPH